MGSRVHEALEFLYRELGDGRPVDRPGLIRRYHDRWEAEFGADVRVVKEDLSPDHYRSVGQTCLENYFRKNEPFPDAGRTLSLERLVEFCLNDDPRYPIRGYVDRLVRGGDDLLEIHDYKTSGRLPRREDLESDAQLALYQVGLGRVFPEQRGVRLIWHYLVHDQCIELEKTEAELAAFERRTRAAIDAVAQAERFDPRPTTLCRWCEYHDLCPEGRLRVEGAQTRSWQESSFVWRYAGIKQAAGDSDANAPALRLEAELLRRNIQDYVVRTGTTVLVGPPGRLVVSPPETDNGERWVMRLES